MLYKKKAKIHYDKSQMIDRFCEIFIRRNNQHCLSP